MGADPPIPVGVLHSLTGTLAASEQPVMEATLLAIALGLGLTGTAAPMVAQSNAGFIRFGKIRDNALDYTLDSGIANQVDRYFLRLKPQKIRIHKILITYPEGFEGEFDPKAMAVELDGKPLPLESSRWIGPLRWCSPTSATPSLAACSNSMPASAASPTCPSSATWAPG